MVNRWSSTTIFAQFFAVGLPHVSSWILSRSERILSSNLDISFATVLSHVRLSQVSQRVVDFVHKPNGSNRRKTGQLQTFLSFPPKRISRDDQAILTRSLM